jgi:hypothetical protein
VGIVGQIALWFHAEDNANQSLAGQALRGFQESIQDFALDLSQPAGTGRTMLINPGSLPPGPI